MHAACVRLVHFFLFHPRHPPNSTLFPYTTLFRSDRRATTADRDRPGRESRRRRRNVPDSTACRLSDSDPPARRRQNRSGRSEEHTSELQSHHDLVCRLLLEKKKKIRIYDVSVYIN